MPTYVWENITWQFMQGKPTIIIFARDIETNKVKKIAIKNFKPYFYAENKNGKYVSCYNDSIEKIICDSPLQLTEYRTKYKIDGINTFNSDIPYEMQYLIDKKIVYGFNEKLEPVDVPLLEPRTIFYDIEVNIPKGESIDIELCKHPIVAIAVLDSYTNESKVFTIGKNKVHPLQVPCGTEKEVLKEFFNYIESTDPDIIAGWNCDEFDLPYIVGRSKYNSVPTNKLNRTGMNIGNKVALSGRTHMDMMVFFKDWSKPMGQFPSYGLKYISKHYADFEYEAFGAKIHELIESNDWQTIVEYNLNDVIALQKIDKKAGLINYHENLRRIVGIKYENTIKRTHIVESLLMRNGCPPMPNRGKHIASGFEGGFVGQSTPGIHSDVAVLDAKSLYPSIILAKNISPDKFGMIPKTITLILNEREKYRKLKLEGKATPADETTEQSLKYIANSFYGVCASPHFKMFDESVASEITATARDIIHSIRTKIKTFGYNVTYSDTDSTFVENIGGVEEAKELEKNINEHLLSWAKDNNVKEEFAPIVKFEKYYKKIFFKKKSGKSEEAAKKKYVGHLIWKDGKDKNQLDYTGIETKRSDTAPITKSVMEEFFETILLKNEPEQAIKNVKLIYNKVRIGDISTHEIAIPKGVKKLDNNTAHVKGVRNGMKLFNITFDASQKPKLLYCKSPYTEICVDDTVEEKDINKSVTIDYEKMADRIIAQKMRSLIESLGYDWSVVIGGQTNLNNLFGDGDGF